MLKGAYKIDGFDLYSSFGWAVSSGSDDFLILPETKDILTIDWPDQNGKEYYLGERFYTDREANLNGWLYAKSEAEWWSNYNNLWAILKAPGERTLYINEFKRNFQIFYKKMSLMNRLTPIISRNQIGAKIQITVQNLSNIFAGEVPDYPNDFMIHKTVSTFQEMNAQGTPQFTTIVYTVLNDEDKGTTNSTYMWLKSGKRVYAATVEDN